MSDNLIFIVDTSESISSYLHPYLSAVNHTILLQKEINPQNLLTLVTFNQTHYYFCLNQPLASIDKPIRSEDLKIGGTTALYDNVNAILVKLQKFYSKMKHTPPIVIILTDGEDNSSVLTEAKHLGLQIARTQLQGWKYVFFGTSQEALDVGKNIGVNICVRYSTTEDSMKKISDVIREVFLYKPPCNAHVDIDISSLCDSMESMKI